MTLISECSNLELLFVRYELSLCGFLFGVRLSTFYVSKDVVYQFKETQMLQNVSKGVRLIKFMLYDSAPLL